MTNTRRRTNLSTEDLNPPHRTGHFVQFYDTEAFLIRSVGDYIASGLDAGEGCILVATASHGAQIEQQLIERGRDLADDTARGDYVTIHAEKLLAEIMNEGTPDSERFAEIVGDLIVRAGHPEGRRPRHVRVFGEMVALLCATNQHDAAQQLEALWNELQAASPQRFALFCAYPMSEFDGHKHSASLAKVCAAHTAVIPDETYTSLQTEEERSRTVALLQQKARSLEAEIAERKALEERLRVSVDRYRSLFEGSTDGILIVDAETQQISQANPAIASLLGTSESELIGQELWQIGLFPTREAAREHLRLLETDEGRGVAAATIRALDAAPRHVEFVSSRFHTNGADRVQFNLRDITAQVAAREAARNNAERLRLLAESMPQKIFTATADGAVDYFNPQWMEFTGLPFEAIKGGGWAQFIHPDDLAENLRVWRRAFTTGEPSYVEHRFRRADGEYRWHMSRIEPFRDADGSIIMWVGASTDFDEKRQQETRKNAFISMASHELKTPVTSLKGFTQLLQRRLQQQVDPQSLLFLDRMATQLDKLNSLVTDLLDVSKMQTSTLAFRETHFDLDDLARETVENVQAATTTHQISLAGATGATVYGDRDRLGQALINLLTNAVKYSPDAESVVVQLSADQRFAEVTVQDFGIGISEEHYLRIFDQFYQVTEQQDGGYPGLGIGLYITRTIVERHGGRLWLESRKGQGSMFHFTVPIASVNTEANVVVGGAACSEARS